MIRHLDEGELQALLDGELPESRVEYARVHMASCGECGAEFEALRDASTVLTAALRELDADERPRRVALIPPSARTRWFRRGFALPKAAALLISFTAAAFAAVPGSPLRVWLADRSEPVETLAATDSEPEEIARVAQPDDDRETGVSMNVASGDLRVLLTDPGPELRIRALITDGPRASVYAVDDPGSARFSTAAGVVEVIGAASGELRIEIPAMAVSATVEVDGTPYLIKDGQQLRLVVSPDDRSGPEVLFQVQ